MQKSKMQLYLIKVGSLNKMIKKFSLLKQENSAIDKPQISILIKPKSKTKNDFGSCSSHLMKN